MCVCSRRVIGHVFADSLHTDIVETALRYAFTFQDADTGGVIFHTDRGCQCTSTQLADVAEELAVLLSLRRTGGVLGQCPAGELLVQPEDRVLRPP